MKTFMILACYLLLAVLTFLFLRQRVAKWEMSRIEALLLGLLWPLFLLFAADWGFGDLVDRAVDRLFRKKI